MNTWGCQSVNRLWRSCLGPFPTSLPDSNYYEEGREFIINLPWHLGWRKLAGHFVPSNSSGFQYTPKSLRIFLFQEGKAKPWEEILNTVAKAAPTSRRIHMQGNGRASWLDKAPTVVSRMSHAMTSAWKAARLTWAHHIAGEQQHGLYLEENNRWDIWCLILLQVYPRTWTDSHWSQRLRFLHFSTGIMTDFTMLIEGKFNVSKKHAILFCLQLML